MNWLRNLPIKRKLTLVMLLTSTVALVLACAAFVAYELVAFRQAIQRDMTVLADVVAENSAAVIKFEDEAQAEKNLSVLKVEPHVVAAAIYKEDGSRFVSYVRSGDAGVLPDQPAQVGVRFEGDYLVLFRPVVLDRKHIGTLFMRVDLEGMRDRLKLYAGLAFLVLLGSCLFTVALAVRLQRVISRPILDLATTTKVISGKKDYSVRAKAWGRDEIGQLTDAFNQMLAEIETGQNALKKAHHSLVEQTGEIRQSVEVLGSSGTKILDFSTRVEASANETATAVSQTTTTVEEVRQTAQISSDKARKVEADAQRVAQTSESGRQSTEETAAGMKHIRQQMESIAESMIKLSEQSQAIGQIITTVDDLAQQSKILSVNAAIEAAKAGEQGKGFAVVAQEIKTLAEQSRQATTRVRGILSDIQRATAAAALATEQGSKAVEQGVKQSAQAGESIVTLAVSVSEAAQATKLIAVASQQQVVGMEQVTAAMQSVKLASAQNVESARQMKTAAQNLNELGQKLKRLVEMSPLPEP